MTPSPAFASKQVFRNDYYTVLLDERQRLVRIVRSEKPFATMPELDACFAQLLPALNTLDRPRYALLSDVRAVAGRNDPEFEAALARLRPLWLGGFRKVGVLVQTSVGLLQVQRYARKDGLVRRVSNDEAELLEYLLSSEE
jgi:hypothetical protein